MEDKTHDSAEAEWIRKFIDPIQDFPIEGVVFQWYGRLLFDAKAFSSVIDMFTKRYQDKNVQAVLGLDARGFIFGAPLAHSLKTPFIPVRKEGKLPGKKLTSKYLSEYGEGKLEMESDALHKDQRVVIIDDVIAAGGTIEAAFNLVEQAGAKILEIACLLELSYLEPERKFPYPLYSLLTIKE